MQELEGLTSSFKLHWKRERDKTRFIYDKQWEGMPEFEY